MVLTVTPRTIVRNVFDIRLGEDSELAKLRVKFADGSEVILTISHWLGGGFILMIVEDDESDEIRSCKTKLLQHVLDGLHDSGSHPVQLHSDYSDAMSKIAFAMHSEGQIKQGASLKFKLGYSDQHKVPELNSLLDGGWRASEYIFAHPVTYVEPFV